MKISFIMHRVLRWPWGLSLKEGRPLAGLVLSFLLTSGQCFHILLCLRRGPYRGARPTQTAHNRTTLGTNFSECRGNGAGGRLLRPCVSYMRVLYGSRCVSISS